MGIKLSLTWAMRSDTAKISTNLIYGHGTNNYYSQIFKEEVDAVNDCLRDEKDIAAYPPRLVLNVVITRERRVSSSLDCEIIVKGVPKLKYYHLYLTPAGIIFLTLVIITIPLNFMTQILILEDYPLPLTKT